MRFVPRLPIANQMNDWWNSVDIVSRFSSAANWTVAITTILAAVSGVCALMFSQREAQLNDRIKSEAAQRQKEEDGRRDLQISKANETAAVSQERTAMLTVENSRLQLELAKVKDRLAPRAISSADRALFLGLATQCVKGKVGMEVAGDPETSDFAVLVARLLAEAGYDIPTDVRSMVPIIMPFPVTGITLVISDPNDPVAGDIQRLLMSIGISAPAQLLPPEMRDPVGTRVLRVGLKP